MVGEQFATANSVFSNSIIIFILSVIIMMKEKFWVDFSEPLYTGPETEGGGVGNHDRNNTRLGGGGKSVFKSPFNFEQFTMPFKI